MTKRIKMPAYEPLPAWYGLEFRQPNELILSIHPAAMEKLRAIQWSKANICRQYVKDCGDFAEPSEGNWGFGQMLKQMNQQGNAWPSYKFTLPVIRGNDEGYRESIVLRATLSVVFMALEYIFSDTDYEYQSDYQQLIVVSGFIVQSRIHGGSLSVILTPAMIQWLAKQPDETELSEVVAAMSSGYCHMWPQKPGLTYLDWFSARCRQPKWINLHVPGDACGLDPEDYHEHSLDRGYSLHPHNVDTSMQQLTFLAGLAKLHEMARRSLA